MRLNLALASAASTIAIGIAGFATPALAQSTGSVDFEKEIVVTGARLKGVAGVDAPDTAKAKQVLDQTIISRQAPGQTINDIINMVPGVSFQNNDPFGSSGGTLTIRGFDSTRISQTFDGLPLNDTGNYALYSNQQLDPELIEQVNVNLGTTDVDSPTASASGSTVNYRTRNPSKDFGVRVIGSAGSYEFMRIFGVVDTGVLTSSGLRAFFAASSSTNNVFLNNYGEINKKQFNAKIYQPLAGDDFISVAGHFNKNRNNVVASLPMWTENYGTRVAGSGSGDRFPLADNERFYSVARCTMPDARPGLVDTTNSCSSLFDYRLNPSDTGNIRINSRFTLADGLVLTVDPSIQYTKANGGTQSLVVSEGLTTAAGYAGYTGFFSNLSGTQYFAGTDLNGDGDKLDTVRLYAPSETQTWRLGVIASLRYDINPDNTVRVAYTYDRGRHKQTGEFAKFNADGSPSTPFPVDDKIITGDGQVLQKRNRLSYAILHQISGEYRGKFMDGALSVTAGLRAPFFKRSLTNNCFSTSNNVICPTTAAAIAAVKATFPYSFNSATNTVTGYAEPQHREFNFSRVLPNVGLTYKVGSGASVFANYSRGLQVPGTDNLYQSFYYPVGNAAAKPEPEITDNFDMGVRYRSGTLIAQLSAWYTIYTNRLASAYDRDLNTTIYRNLGRVNKYGIDGSVAFSPVENVTVYAFGSYLKSKIKDNIDAGFNCNQVQVNNKFYGCTTVGNVAYLQTAGKRESGSPVYTFGGRVEGSVGPLSIGVQAKRTGPRYVNDQNLPFLVATNYNSGAGNASTAVAEYFPAKSPAYTIVDLDAKLSLEFLGMGKQAYLLFNVQNLFDKTYVGAFSGTTNFLSTTNNATSAGVSPVTFAQLGSPRTFIGTVSFGF